MKKFVLLVLLASTSLLAQIPNGYYNAANGLSGYALKTALKNIITTGHNPQNYDMLYTLYATSDNDEYYDNSTQTNTILDIYSENPSGSDPYNFTLTQDCSGVSITGEGLCYNREHIFPQGFFNSSTNTAPHTDAHHVIPTDGYVNNGRSNYPFGMVGTAQTTYSNGSKWGNSISPGYNDRVFEPIDEFKGDVARMMLYFATRYEDNYNDTTWDNPNNSNYDPRDGSQNRWYEQWFVDQMLAWHAQDPVSQREIDRNNDVYNFQGNRNPFIDNPQYVTMIWTTSGGSNNGSIFPELSGMYVDANTNGIVDAGDQIQYSYSIDNIGTTTLYNVRATASLGTFNPGNQVASLTAGQSINNPFGSLTYLLTSNDINSACGCVSNQLMITADFNAAGSNGSFTVPSDDPNNFTNNDSNNDMLPDDITIVNLPNTGTGVASDLMITEYIEGSSNNKAIELGNFTGSSINLSQYSLQISQNGNATWTNPLTLSGSLNDQQVYVIARGNAATSITANADQLVGNGGPLDFNGNDAVGLFKNGVLIDIVGDPASSADTEKDQTLVRKSFVNAPNSIFDKLGEWDQFANNTDSDLGMHTFDGTASITDNTLTGLTIYPNPSQGRLQFTNNHTIDQVKVYDAAGRYINCDYSTSAGLVIDRSGMYFVQVTVGALNKTFKVFVNK